MTSVESPHVQQAAAREPVHVEMVTRPVGMSVIDDGLRARDDVS